MVFAPIKGHELPKAIVMRAVESGKLHHAYRFEGPAGVGKERVAFALAQSLVCTAGNAIGCGVCRACTRAVTLSEDEPRVPLHPDVVLVARGLYSQVTQSKESSGIGVEQVKRVAIPRALHPPHEARKTTILIRDADELTTSAANALLKTLEEPPAHVQFVLLSSRPHRLLDTIRSRTLPVRFGPLPQAALEEILAERGLRTDVAELAEGSAAEAIALADPTLADVRESFIRRARDAAAAGTAATALEFAGSQLGDRTAQRRLIAYLAQDYANEAKRRVSVGDDRAAERCVRSYEVAREALADLEAQAQPVLALEQMLLRLRHA